MNSKRKLTHQQHTIRQPCFTDVIAFIEQHKNSSMVMMDNVGEDISISSDEDPMPLFGVDGKMTTVDSEVEPLQSRGNVDDAKHKFNIDQCVAMLEPHLESFRALNSYEVVHDSKDVSRRKSKRAKMDTNVGIDQHKQKEHDEIPPQLLRLARFFKSRWGPIRRAVLRPATALEKEEEKIEFGSSIRLQLACALQKKGFIAIAELDELLLSFRSHTCTTSSEEHHQDKSMNGTASDKIEAALSKLPLEAALSASIDGERAMSSTSRFPLLIAIRRHIRPLLETYCESYEKLSEIKKATESVGEDNPEVILIDGSYNSSIERLSPQEVADLALAAFNGMIISRGFEFDTTQIHTNEQAFNEAEQVFIKMLLDDSTNGGVSIVAKEIKNRIQNLLTESIKNLEGIHIFSLGKILNYMNEKEADKCIIHSIKASFQRGGTNGLSTLPKLISLMAINRIRSNMKKGCNASIIAELKESFLIGLRARLEHILEEELEVYMSSRDRFRGKICNDGSKNKFSKYISLIFQTSSYLLEGSFT